jgi:hypothetical protein
MANTTNEKTDKATNGNGAAATGTTNEANHTRLADWIGDIVALESHVEEAMDKQLKLKGDNTELAGDIQRLHDAVLASKKRAIAFQEQYGSTGGNPIIKVGSNLLGKAAGLIDLVREDSISKALRDDYTAYNLLAISYTMLHTTAMALDDSKVMAFAEEGLRTYARLVQSLNHMVPLAVYEELKANGDYDLRKPNVVAECRKTIDKIWKSTSS